MSENNPLDDNAILTPAEVLRISRGVLRQSDVVALVRTSLTAAIEAQDAGARTFLRAIAYPEKTGEVEDLRFKRVVFCSFQEYNEIEKLKDKIASLEKELAGLKRSRTPYHLFDGELCIGSFTDKDVRDQMALRYPEYTAVDDA